MENAETLQEAKATKIVVTCAHCLNALKNEYPQLDLNCEVVHHTQLLNRLVRDGRLTPVAPPEGSVAGRTIHLPRRVLSGTAQRDLRSAARSACFTARRQGRRDASEPGAVILLWRGRRPDVDGGETRHPDQREPHRGGTAYARHRRQQRPRCNCYGCPFCRIMLTDGLTAAAAGSAPRQPKCSMSRNCSWNPSNATVSGRCRRLTSSA